MSIGFLFRQLEDMFEHSDLCTEKARKVIDRIHGAIRQEVTADGSDKDANLFMVSMSAELIVTALDDPSPANIRSAKELAIAVQDILETADVSDPGDTGQRILHALGVDPVAFNA